MRGKFVCAALLTALACSPALADDPKDPAMRTEAARARDREQIRQMNLAQLAHVRARDAGYAAGWAATRKAGGADAAQARYAARTQDYSEAQTEYARSRADYERRMANWRRAVAACRAGDWSACE